MCGYTETYPLGKWHFTIKTSGRFLLIARPLDEVSQVAHDVKYFRLHDSVNHRTAIRRMKEYGWKILGCVKVKPHDRVQPATRDIRYGNTGYDDLLAQVDVASGVGGDTRAYIKRLS